MAKFRPAGMHRGRRTGSNKALIPCALVILVGFALIFLLLYEVLKSGF